MYSHQDEGGSAPGLSARFAGGAAGVSDVFFDRLFGEECVVLGNDSHFSAQPWDDQSELAVDFFAVDNHRTFTGINFAAEEF